MTLFVEVTFKEKSYGQIKRTVHISQIYFIEEKAFYHHRELVENKSYFVDTFCLDIW